MYTQVNTQSGYISTQRQIKTPRALEYEIVARVTYELKQAAEDKSTNYSEFVRALHKNNQLWTTFAANVADENNELSRELRAQIFYLSEFCSRHTAQVLSDDASISPLLDINISILQGLRSQARES